MKGTQKRCAKRKARRARRDSRRKCRASKRKAKSEWKEFKGQLRQAFMNVYLLPKILVMAKPSLEKAIADMAIVKESSGATSGVAIGLQNVSAKACVQGTIKEFLKMKLQILLAGPMFLVTTMIRTALFKVIDSIFLVISGVLVGSVGSIPFVGGALAVAVGGAVSIVKMAIKGGLFYALNKIYKLLLTLTVDGIMAILFPSGKLDMSYFPDGKFDMSKAAEVTQAAQVGPKSFQDEKKELYTKKAEASEAAAAQAQAGVAKEGDLQSKEFELEEADGGASDKDADLYDDANDDENEEDDL